MRGRVFTAEPPERSQVQAYRQRGAYTDAYYLDLPFGVTLDDYIEAFYTTPLFKCERLVLALLVAKPSTDSQARALACRESLRFAAWTVEAREPDQILMCDFLSKTRSWLSCQALPGGTRLWFGSVIVPERIYPNGKVWLGFGFHALLGFHKIYSKALLSAAGQRLGLRA